MSDSASNEATSLDIAKNNRSMIAGNSMVLTESVEVLHANNALIETNNRLLRANAVMMQKNHDLLLAIAAKLGIAD
jgi:uncharacterized protein YaaN involved in tellurite resistance